MSFSVAFVLSSMIGAPDPISRNDIDSSVIADFEKLYSARYSWNPENPKGGSFSRIYQQQDCYCIETLNNSTFKPVDTICVQEKFLRRNIAKKIKSELYRDSLSKIWLSESWKYQKFDSILEISPWRGLSIGITGLAARNPFSSIEYTLTASWSGLNCRAATDFQSEAWLMPGIGLGSWLMLQYGANINSSKNIQKLQFSFENNFFEDARHARIIHFYHVPSLIIAIEKFTVGRDDWGIRIGVALDLIKISDYRQAKLEIDKLKQ